MDRKNIVKMVILPKAIYRFSAFSIKIPTAFFNETRTNSSKIHMKPQKTPNSQSNPEKEHKAGGIMLPDFKLYYKATIRYCHNNRHTDQWNRIESPDINPHIYVQLINNKGAMNTQWEKDSLFSTWCWENWRTTCKRMKLDL